MNETFFTFFNILNNDVMQIKWAHAVNSIADLESALNDSSIHMIESDVVISSSTGKPVMAHPPQTESDLTFESWLFAISNWTRSKKGAKTDFKSLESARQALTVLSERQSDLNHFPLWLNADVCPGIYSSTATPLDGVEFLSLCNAKAFGRPLSLGWTTPPNITPEMKLHGGYGSRETQAMIQLLTNVSDACHVTFPIRASLLGDVDYLADLMARSERYSLTVWTSSSRDTLTLNDYRQLAELRTKFGKHRVFYDLPDNDLKQIKEFVKN